VLVVSQVEREVKRRGGGQCGAGVEAFRWQLHRFIIGEAGPEATGVEVEQST